MGEVVDLERHRRRRMRGLPRAPALVRRRRDVHTESPRHDAGPASEGTGKSATIEDAERGDGGDSTDPRE